MASKTIRRMISIGLLLIMVIIFSISSDVFLNFGNIANLLKDSAYLGLIAIGMAFVIIGGGVDLSAGGMACLVGILCVRMSTMGLNGFLIVLAGVILGMLCGFINALFVTRVKLTEFVATLALGFVYSGLTLIFAFRDDRGTITSVAIPKWSSLRAFAGNVGGIFYITIVWIVVAVIAYIVLTRTTFGLHTYSIGSHAKSAQMSGVNNDRIKMLGYIICGACVGLAVVLQASLLGSSPLNIGSGYEFQAIAACVVGGVVLGGGKGDPISALVGALFFKTLMNGLYKFGLATSWEYILQGGIIVVATVFDAVFNRATSKRLLARAQ
ncbi:MAG: ABC transporter permease [Oscillospiraceae bacterium]|nr:ABC transporter permease [Oscillospiraceae bacterium]